MTPKKSPKLLAPICFHFLAKLVFFKFPAFFFAAKLVFQISLHFLFSICRQISFFYFPSIFLLSLDSTSSFVNFVFPSIFIFCRQKSKWFHNFVLVFKPSWFFLFILHFFTKSEKTFFWFTEGVFEVSRTWSIRKEAFTCAEEACYILADISDRQRTLKSKHAKRDKFRCNGYTDSKWW